MNKIEIWSPRWHDRTVLIAKYKVKKDNTIVFTKGTLEGQEYEIKGDKIRQYPIESNSKIDCYAVPLEDIGYEHKDN